MRRFLIAVIAAALSLFCLAGCQAGGAEKGEKITVYVYSVDLMTKYAPYVESHLSDVDIEWVVGNNDLDFYKFYQENGELPDIITTRRFSVNDAASLQPHLMNLSETEIAASFYTTYLESYRNADGSVNWLPACGEVDGLIANKALFDRYNIELPTDYASFVSACQAFESHGIRGFQTDFFYDYTCMEVLQGTSISQLQTLEGREWRLAYENSETLGLDDEVWPGVFERFETFIDDMGLAADDVDASFNECRDGFVAEKIAIVRGTGVDLGTYRSMNMENVVFLPYFGETEADNWILTYPSFQVAVSKSVEESDARRQAALDVLEAMLSNEGQNLIAPQHSAVSYNKDVTLELAPELETLLPYIESNHLYIRLASNEFFAVSKDVVGKMLSGEYDAAQAYEAFDSQLQAPEVEADKVCTINASYPYEFNANGGNPAASAVANTLREAAGTELLIMPFYTCTGPILDVCYTQKALQFVIGPNAPAILDVELTGAEVTELARVMVEGSGAMVLVPFSTETLPTTSGFELKVSENGDGYKLESVTVNDEPIDLDRTYTVSYVDNVSHAKLAYAAALGDEAVSELPTQYPMARGTWTKYILEGLQPVEPSSYITLS